MNSNNIPKATLYFITLEDITGNHHDENDIVYNFALPLEKRMEQFLDVMEKKFDHIFSPDELEILSSYGQHQAHDFINKVREYIYPWMQP
jgi:hypothetical protein